MGVNPIDLQIMYSNLNTIAKTAVNQQQGAQLVQSMQESSIIRQNAEAAEQVKKAVENDTKSSSIKADSDGASSSGYAGNKENKNEETPEENSNDKNIIRESFLGQHIDIMR